MRGRLVGDDQFRGSTFPKWFAAENANGSPVNALWATNILIQVFLILSFFSKSAYQFFHFLASVAVLPPYVLRLALSGETYDADGKARRRDIAVGLIATLYGLWLVYAAGLNCLPMCAVLFAPCILVYARARKEHGVPAFVGKELFIAMGIGVLALFAIYLMWTDGISTL